MSLAALGWLDDAPTGNRLRWSYPAESLAADGFLDLPQVVVVERAPVGEPIHDPDSALGGSPSAAVPSSWWDDHGTVLLAGFIEVAHAFPSPMQAVTFTYRGTDARLQARDAERNRIVAERTVTDGEFVALEAPAIDLLTFRTFAAELQGLRTLDLVRDRSLAWKQIAEIHVAATAKAAFADVRERYGAGVTLVPEEWSDLVALAVVAEASTPASVRPGRPSPWQAFELALSLRWEFAVLYGSAFCDGPHAETSGLDTVRAGDLLRSVPPTSVVYRVREQAGRVSPSNLAVCAPSVAAPLVAPNGPSYIGPEVRLTDAERFEAALTMRWKQLDARAIGVEIDEEIGPSLALASKAVRRSFQSRSRRPDDPPGGGELARIFDVLFHDVHLRARARATDAWDRTSVYSPWTPSTALALRHHPPAPPLATALYRAGVVSIRRGTGPPDWTPDAIVRRAAGRVVVYRQVRQPRVDHAEAGMPAHVEGRLHKTTIAGVSDPSAFSGGYLIAGRVKARIARIVGGSQFFFDAPDEGGTSLTLFAPGPVTLQQSSRYASLWLERAQLPAIDLPAELVFTDLVPDPTESADVLSYCVRLAYLGRLGPPSNIVAVARIPATPLVPPPFAVELLGVDFYHRTMVKVAFTKPVSGGAYSVWWADGAHSTEQFGLHAVPGEYRSQAPHEDHFLYDVLSLPIPRNVDRIVTIGVQRTNAGGGQSNFQTVHVAIEAEFG